MAKKLKVSVSDSKQIEIIGLASQANDYRLLYFTGAALGFSFKKLADLPLYGKKDKLGDFSFYHYNCTEKHLLFYLFANKNQGKIAIPTFRNFDYFLVMEGELETSVLNEILSKFRSIQLVQAAMHIPLSSLKDHDLLLEDIELHLLDLNKEKKPKAFMWSENKVS